MAILTLVDPKGKSKPRKLFSKDFCYKNPLNVSEHQEDRLAYFRSHTTTLRYMKNIKRSRAARAICRKLNMERNCKKFDLLPLDDKLKRKILIKLDLLTFCRARIANKQVHNLIENMENKPMFYFTSGIEIYIKFKQVDYKLSNESRLSVQKKGPYDYSSKGLHIVTNEHFFKDVANVRFKYITYVDSVYNPMNGTNTLEGVDRDGALEIVSQLLSGCHLHCQIFNLRQEDAEVRRLDKAMSVVTYKTLVIQEGYKRHVAFSEYDGLEGVKRCENLIIHAKDIPTEGLYAKYKDYRSVKFKDSTPSTKQNFAKNFVEEAMKEDTSANKLRRFKHSCSERRDPQQRVTEFTADDMTLLHRVAWSNHGREYSKYYLTQSKTELILFIFEYHHHYSITIFFVKDKEALYIELMNNFFSRNDYRRRSYAIDASQHYDQFMATDFENMGPVLERITALRH